MPVIKDAVTLFKSEIDSENAWNIYIKQHMCTFKTSVYFVNLNKDFFGDRKMKFIVMILFHVSIKEVYLQGIKPHDSLSNYSNTLFLFHSKLTFLLWKDAGFPKKLQKPIWILWFDNSRAVKQESHALEIIMLIWDNRGGSLKLNSI